MAGLRVAPDAADPAAVADDDLDGVGDGSRVAAVDHECPVHAVVVRAEHPDDVHLDQFAPSPDRDRVVLRDDVQLAGGRAVQVSRSAIWRPRSPGTRTMSANGFGNWPVRTAKPRGSRRRRHAAELGGRRHPGRPRRVQHRRLRRESGGGVPRGAAQEFMATAAVSAVSAVSAARKTRVEISGFTVEDRGSAVVDCPLQRAVPGFMTGQGAGCYAGNRDAAHSSRWAPRC